MSLAPIVRALGGELSQGGRRAVIPGPGHSKHDRSVSLLVSNGRLIVHSFGRSSWLEVMQGLRAAGFVDGEGRVSGGAGAGWTSHRPAGAPDRTAVAQRLWGDAQPLARQLAALHLRRRHINRRPPVSEALRHHGLVPTATYADTGRRLPALLAAITDAAGRLAAVEITYLNPSGDRARDLKTSRKVIGALPPSSAVRLDAAAPELLVGEGVVTTLSASRRFDLPGWALLSTGNLRSWRAPKDVRRVLIAADRGVDGERSARWLRGSLLADGVEARIAWPPAPASDWNEALALKEGEGGGDCVGWWNGPFGDAGTRP